MVKRVNTKIIEAVKYEMSPRIFRTIAENIRAGRESGTEEDAVLFEESANEIERTGRGGRAMALLAMRALKPGGKGESFEDFFKRVLCD